MKTLPPELASLFEKHNIPYTWRGEKGPTWNGHNLDIAGASDNAWVCHELAHCLTASRLDLPNYGLGSDPGGGRIPIRCYLMSNAQKRRILP